MTHEDFLFSMNFQILRNAADALKPKNANKLLHRMAVTLCSLATGELILYNSSGGNIMNIDFTAAKWFNQPKLFEITDQSVKVTTEPNTDFWQRSYYGFRNDNAHALLLESEINFSFTAKVSFKYRESFDQCGLIIYLDSDNWFKASIEYENENISRLGSVVTNHGYSDWATTDIPATTAMWYRLSRRGPDFLIESSPDGMNFTQMRIFHLHCLGETSAEMAGLNPPAPAERPIRFGLYACSPLNSSFETKFDNFGFDNCLWMAHGTECE